MRGTRLCVTDRVFAATTANTGHLFTGNDNARWLSGRYPFDGRLKERSAVIVVTGCNARNVRAIKTDIGKFTIAELGQLADIALIIPESLDHADD